MKAFDVLNHTSRKAITAAGQSGGGFIMLECSDDEKGALNAQLPHPHDAVDPLGLVLGFDGTQIGLSTDLGRATSLVEDRLKGCDVLIMEFNYDQEMVEEGPYPLDIKRRIKGPEGHLSNKQAGDLLSVVSNKNLKFVVLAHISKINNLPKKAHQQAIEALGGCGISEVNILISKQNEPVPMIEL